MRRIFLIELVFLLASGFTFSAHASCTDIDLTNYPFQMPDGKVRYLFAEKRYQEDSRQCFAFSSADVFSQQIKAPVSELYAALLTNRNRTVKQDQQEHRYYKGLAVGDSGLKTFIELGNEPVCLESSLPFSQYTKIAFSHEKSLKNLASAIANNRLTEKSAEVIYLRTVFPSLTLEQIRGVGLQYNKNNNNYVTFLFAKYHCDNTHGLRALPPFVFKFGTFSHATAVPLLQQSLAAGRVARLDVFDSVLYRGGHGQTGGHSLTAIAQKQVGSECLYKLRDPQLENCSDFAHAIDCSKTTATFWMSEAWLTRGIANTAILLDAPKISLAR